jgi:hypothetical protein
MKAKHLNFFRIFFALMIALCARVSAETFWQKMLRITGVSATPSLQKSGQEEMPAGGQIWIANLQSGQLRKLTVDSGYRSPVFTPDGRSILALKSNEVWRIPLDGGSVEKLHAVAGLSKLIGFDHDTNQLCVLVEQAQRVSAGLLTLTSGQVALLEYDQDDRQSRRMMTQLKGWEREYGTTSVYPARQKKKSISGNIEWDDIFLKRAEEDPVNVSRSDGVNCGHPSLSPNSQEVAFIKATQPAEK